MNTNFVMRWQQRKTQWHHYQKSAHGSTQKLQRSWSNFYDSLFFEQFDFGGDAKALQVSASLLHEDFAGEKAAYPCEKIEGSQHGECGIIQLAQTSTIAFVADPKPSKLRRKVEGGVR